MMFRPASPNDPMIVLVAKAQVLNSVPGTHGCPFGFPTTLGRAALATSPPPSDVERLVAMSVGVYQFPVVARVMPPPCKLPMIWSPTPKALPPTALFFPKVNRRRNSGRTV